MGVLFDYFATASDDAAATAIDLKGGPGGARSASPELQAAIKSGDREALHRLLMPKVQVSEHGFHALSVKGIDPFIHIGQLEVLLTGVAADTVRSRDRFAKAVAVRDEGERLVLTLTDELRAALSDAVGEQLDAVAVAWSGTEDFWGHAEPESLAHFLHELAALARHATEAGERLYCWVCV